MESATELERLREENRRLRRTLEGLGMVYRGLLARAAGGGPPPAERRAEGRREVAAAGQAGAGGQSGGKAGGPDGADPAARGASDPSELYFQRQMALFEGVLDRVLYLRSEAPYVVARFFRKPDERPLFLRLPLNAIEARAGAGRLVRVSRSLMVNPDHVVGARKSRHPDYEVRLEDAEGALHALPVGRSYSARLRRERPLWFA